MLAENMFFLSGYRKTMDNDLLDGRIALEAAGAGKGAAAGTSS
jgi:hypothetical protein